MKGEVEQYERREARTIRSRRRLNSAKKEELKQYEERGD